MSSRIEGMYIRRRCAKLRIFRYEGDEFNLLLTTPSAVDHVPPQDTDTHEVLVEEVHDPAELGTRDQSPNKIE